MNESTTKRDDPGGQFPRPLFRNPANVPEPPSHDWCDLLRWLVAVMDGSDSSLPFVASLLSDALRHDGFLTKKQAKAADDILFRVRFEYLAGRLECQRRPTPPAPPPGPESVPEPAGAFGWYIAALDLSDHERRLLRVIGERIDAETGEARVSQEILRKQARLNWPQFQKARDALKARGIIEFDRTIRRDESPSKRARLPYAYRLAGREVGK